MGLVKNISFIFLFVCWPGLNEVMAQKSPGDSMLHPNYVDSIYGLTLKARTTDEKINAFQQWLPLAILVHHPKAEQSMNDFSTLAALEGSKLATGISLLNKAYFLAEYRGDYNKALEYGLQAKDIFEELKAKPQQVMTYNRLVLLILWNQIERKKAIYEENLYETYLVKSLQLSRELKDSNLVINTLGLIGSYYNVTEQNGEKALQCFLDAEKRIDAHTTPEQDLLIRESIAIVLSDFPDEEELMYYVKKCESHPFFDVFDYGKSNMYRSLASFYMNKKRDLDKALQYAKRAYDISLQLNAPAYISQGEKRLYEVYKAMNNVEMALLYHEKYKATEDSFSRERFQRTFAEYDVQKKEKTIIQQEFELAKKNNLLYGSLIALVVTLLIGYIVFQSRKKTQQLKMQELLIEQKEETMLAVMQAEESERKRIAGDLHDSVAQKLVVAKLNLEAFGNYLPEMKQEQQQVYDNIFNLVRDSASEVRDLSHSMVPQTAFRSGLTDAIKTFIDKIDQRNIQVSFAADGNMTNLDEHKMTMIYRVVCECIQNTLKHAHASQLDISLITDQDVMDIIVEDNGVGFDPDAPDYAEGLGMQHIHSRIAFLNGRMEINSRPGKGTAIAFCIPLI